MKVRGFATQARSPGCPLAALETPDEQLFAMSSLSNSLTDTMLRQTLERAGGHDFEALLRAWKTGDEAALVEATFGDIGEDEHEGVTNRAITRQACTGDR